MPAPNLRAPLSQFVLRCDRHYQLVGGLPTIEIKLQRLVAELIMMRLFDDFQDLVAGIAVRLACGAPYGDGAQPSLLTSPAKSTAGALNLFENHGRVKTKRAQWSRVQYIGDTIENVIAKDDHFLVACQAHSQTIAEMQAIRNRIAHGNYGARRRYASVVRRYYGASLNHVSPGMLLLSPRFSPPLIERYVTSSRVIAKSVSRV